MTVDLASQWYVFVLFGLVSGFASALLGIGGGVVLVPLLLLVAGFDPNHARGSALGYMVATALVGAISYHAMKEVSLSGWVIVLLSAGGIVGAYFGAKVGARIDPDWVKRIFAAVMVYAAVQMFLGTLKKAEAAKPAPEKPTAEAGIDP